MNNNHICINTDGSDVLFACPVCGNQSSYCQGHGEIGDPAGFAIMHKHDNGDHSECIDDGTYC